MGMPRHVCPRFQSAAELIGRRWSAAVIRVALDGPARFSDFRDAVDGLSSRLLAQRLRELEAAGIISRRPPGGRSLYQLTDKGRALATVVVEIEQWATEWIVVEGPTGTRRR